jgi:glycosyltransferase involved in cell wall biosynthesis
VLYVGRLVKVKGPDLALAAFGQLAAASALGDALLLVAGDGPLSEELAALARRFTAGQVRLLGPVADPIALYQAADILLAPSRSEGLSNTLLEAMAAGLAILATGVGGNRALLADGETGCLVPPAPDPLAAALAPLLRDPARRAALGAAAAAAARRAYDLDRVAARYEDLYRVLLAQRSRSAFAPNAASGKSAGRTGKR